MKPFFLETRLYNHKGEYATFNLLCEGETLSDTVRMAEAVSYGVSMVTDCKLLFDGVRTTNTRGREYFRPQDPKLIERCKRFARGNGWSE